MAAESLNQRRGSFDADECSSVGNENTVTTVQHGKMRSILIINPNSTKSMTDSLKPVVDSLQFEHVGQHYHD